MDAWSGTCDCGRPLRGAERHLRTLVSEDVLREEVWSFHVPQLNDLEEISGVEAWAPHRSAAGGGGTQRVAGFHYANDTWPTHNECARPLLTFTELLRFDMANLVLRSGRPSGASEAFYVGLNAWKRNNMKKFPIVFPQQMLGCNAYIVVHYSVFIQ